MAKKLAELQQSCSHCNGTGKEFKPAETGEYIRNLRESCGISLRELARRVGWSPAYQSYLERGCQNWNQANFDKVIFHLEQ